MKPWLLPLGVCVVLAAGGPARGQAAGDAEKSIRVVQQKSFVKLLRVELLPTYTVSLNETLTSHMGVGATLRFHITDEWSIGAEYIKYFGRLSQLASDIGNGYQVYPEKHLMDFFAGGHVSWVPVFGKFLLFGGPIVYWDAYLLGGGGVTRSALSNRPTFDWGAGFRFALTKFLTWNVEVRDYFFWENFHAGREYVNNVVFATGIGLFVPFSHDYVHPK